MGKVYEGALFTIVPLAARACSEGFPQSSQATVGIDFQSIILPEIYGKFYLRHIPCF
jgi:hypothetical protein